MIKLKDNNDMTIQQDKKMWQIHEQLKRNLQFVCKKIKIYYNLWHENISIFRMKQRIYLSCENFKTKQSCEKLDYWKMRAFKIKWQTESMTFELKLSKHFKTHLIVHIILLESASENTKLTKIMNVEKYENQNYIVEKILKKNQINEINYYLVKWKDYDNSENIWKSIEHFEKTQQTLRNFLQHQDLFRNCQTTWKK